MTLLGKVMVFFVLLFAMITGGMIVKVYLTRTNWKNAYEDVKAQATVQNASWRAEEANARKLIEEQVAANKALAKEIENLQNQLTGLKSQIGVLEKERSQYIGLSNGQLANSEAATIEIGKLKTERDMNADLLTRRNAHIVKLEKDIVDFRNRAVQAEISLNAMTDRAQALMLKVEQMARDLDGFKRRGLTPDSGANRGPAVDVRGRVTEVASNMAQISLGADHGLKKLDVLQVYRLSPQATWLGTLRITEIQEHTSVGVFSPAAKTATIMKGDTVDTKVSR